MHYLSMMQATPQLEEYYNFLKWFQKYYPQLNNQYRQYITIPRVGEGVRVTRKGLDSSVFDQLVQIEHDYYHPWRNIADMPD